MKSKQEMLFEIKISVFLLIFALIYVVLSIVGIEDAGRFFAASGKLQSTTFPYFIGALFTVTALYLLGKSVYQYNRALKLDQIDKNAVKKPFPFPVKAALPLLVAFIAYTILLRPIGFLVDSIIFSLFVMFYVNKKNKVRNVIFSIVFPVLVFLLFNYVLSIRLPIGTIFGGR